MQLVRKVKFQMAQTLKTFLNATFHFQSNSVNYTCIGLNNTFNDSQVHFDVSQGNNYTDNVSQGNNYTFNVSQGDT